MNEQIKTRKRRSDRRHMIYVLINNVTGEQYVGITAYIDRTGKETLAARFSRHVGRAFNQNKSWKLCESIRKYGAEAFTPIIFDAVRGKALAHQTETELRKTGKFALNTA